MHTDDPNHRAGKNGLSSGPQQKRAVRTSVPPVDSPDVPEGALGDQLRADEGLEPISTVLGDLAEYAIAPDEQEIEAIRVVQTVVRRPAHDEWFRTSASTDHTIDLLVLESSRDRTTYLVAKAVRATIRASLKAKRVVVCVNRYGDVFLWLVSLPSSSGNTSPWITSAHRAVELATKNWTRCRLPKPFPPGLPDPFPPAHLA